MNVTSQALISFTLGKYKDEVLCDVLPMHVGDIWLGRPWQFDRRVMYDGYLNRYSLVKDGIKTTLVPLSFANVFADQLKLEEKNKEFEEKELKEKQELSEKIEKSQREKHSDMEINPRESMEQIALMIKIKSKENSFLNS